MLHLTSKKQRIIFNVLKINLYCTIVYWLISFDDDHWEGLDEVGATRFEKFFNRFYFSLMITSTVGVVSGVPKSMLCRSIVMIQVLLVMSQVIQFAAA
ncbi:hypothetical protein CPAV1605_350 [seawater metagenome]|uniref:Potassium channel domain-containing protein n=1 Tax=seawater metagenome TaxID=1561972 RepID=A0A5E8CL56_9ZZZZ